MTHDVFISYSTNDQTIVEGVSHYLEQNGIRCFVAYRDIPRGVVWAAAITEAIEISKLMIVVFSEHFNRSPQVDREIEMCIEEGKPILTFKIQNAPFTGAKKYYLKNINWIDAFPNPNECFGLLLESVKKLLPQNTQENQTPTPKNEPITTTQTSEPKPENIEVITQSAVCLLKVRPNLTCEIWIDGDKNTVAEANSITKIPLKKGTFWLEFVSVENKEDKYAREFTVTNQEELIVVDLESVVKERVRFENSLRLFSENNKIGYKNIETNEVIIPAKYGGGSASFCEGLAWLKLNGKFGYIDKNGKEVIPLKYDDAKNFEEGLAKVKLSNKWGFIDKTEKEVIPLKYDDAYSFSKGVARVKLNGKWGLIDKTGKEVVHIKYDEVQENFIEGFVNAALNGKYGFVNENGKEVTSFKYDYAGSFNEGLVKVGLNEKYGYIDKTGKEVITIKYDGAGSFYEGMAQIKLNKKWGFLDKTGKEVIPFKYDSAGSFSEGLAVVSVNYVKGYIDKTGKEVIPIKYSYAGDFQNCKAHVKFNNEWFDIDKAGNRI